MSGYHAHLSMILEGRLGRGREVRMEEHGRTVRIRKLDHGLVSHGRSQ